LSSVGFSLRRKLLGAFVCEKSEEKERVLWFVLQRDCENKRNAVVISAKNLRSRCVFTVAQAEAYAT
jgi:hypothetical protein